MQECVLAALHLCLLCCLLEVQSMLWCGIRRYREGDCRAFSEPAPSLAVCTEGLSRGVPGISELLKRHLSL